MFFQSRRLFIPVFTLLLIVLSAFPIFGQRSYEEYADFYKKYDYSKRMVPEIPPAAELLRVIIDSDAKCEIDDQWALALALLSPERFDIVGLVGATFLWGGPESIKMSVWEIEKLLELTGRTGEIPVYHGSMPLQYAHDPSPSEGVDFIIREAMKATPENPLWIISLGAATNVASAFLTEPEIRERIRVLWHGRTKWPEKCHNFNVFGDPHAARVLFHSPLSFLLFDTGTHLSCPMEESAARVAPHGAIGGYLHEIRIGNDWFESPTKGFFDLGDIAILLDPSAGSYEVVNGPEVSQELDYHFTDSKGKILRCYDVDRDRSFELLYDKLEALSESIK
jgi:hypothetical protein